MSYRPGISVTVTERPSGVSVVSVDSGTAFMAGETDRGRDDHAILLRSFADYETFFGPRLATGFLYDAAEAFFREGGSSLYLARVTAATAVGASVTLNDGSAVPSIKVQVTPGTWGNTLKANILADGTLTVVDAAGKIVDQSPPGSDKTALINWSILSNQTTVTSAGAGTYPAAVANVALTGGTTVASADADWQQALALFTANLGPGQVSLPGRTVTVAHGWLLDHAALNNRVAILDAPDSTSASTIKAAATALSTSVNRRYGAMFAPWVYAPGVAIGSTRVLPYSPTQSGILARTPVGNAGAGLRARSRFLLDVRATFTDLERDDLNTNGISVVRVIEGNVETYGGRTLASPTTEPNWIELDDVRLINEIKAKAALICERHVFDTIDGRGRTISAFNAELVGMIVPYYDADVLYGATPDEAFRVDTGPQVNTPTTISEGRLRAIIYLRCSPFAELVEVEIVKVAASDAI